MRKGEIYFDSAADERDWLDNRRKKRASRKSKFDIQPNPDAPEQYQPQQVQPKPSSDALLPGQTRHARRLYIGQLPLEVNEQEVHKFFREAISVATGPASSTEDPILSVYINRERRFAFVEFKTMEICTACLALDGIDILNKGKVKVKRPNDYNPLLASSTPSKPLPKFDVSKLGIVSATVPDGPNKIFIGGLPYHLSGDQVMELLRAFGPIRAFHLVKADATSTTSKGYCFVEYSNSQTTPVAIMGLNGMDMGGGKVLSARMAASKSDDMPTQPTNVVEGVDVEALLNVAFSGGGMPATTGINIDMAANGEVDNNAMGQSEATSSILVLLNMVMDEDLETDENYNELVEEVKSECEKYGKLVTLVIPRVQDQYTPSALKKIYLQYSTDAEAINANSQLGGRQFGPNTVVTTYFSEEDYLLGKLY